MTPNVTIGPGEIVPVDVHDQIERLDEDPAHDALRDLVTLGAEHRNVFRIFGDALANAEDEAAEGYRFSFDMLGEAARTAEDAAA